MEERIIDNEREIKIKRKREGDDVVDALAEDGDELPEEEDIVLEFPEDDEYDEDLVGLTPSQLKEELARREKAKKEAEAECEKLTLEGEKKLAAGDYDEAETLFTQALLYSGESVRAGKGLWTARTKDFSDDEAFYEEENAEELAEGSEEVRAFVLEHRRASLEAAREEYRKEAEPLKEKVEKDIAERREPFLANRKYYRLRLRICFAAFVACVIAIIICASMIYNTKGMLPVWLAIGFGGLAFICLGFTLYMLRKTLVAQRLCVANERLSSTEEGARLEDLNSRRYCLDLILGK